MTLQCNKFHKIEKCRVCGNEHYVTVLDLGEQYLSGIFPKEIDPEMYKGPLTLVKCDESKGGCGHVQLEHTFDLPTMYGDEYGYRSGLNGSMIKHLKGCLLYTSPSPRDLSTSRMPSSA